MLKFGNLLLAGAFGAGCLGSVFAAEPSFASIDAVNGKILVNQGKGFVSARPGTQIRPGDRVIALDNASARIVYPNGCVTNLRENSLLAMDATGCQKKPVNPYGADMKLAVAIGGEVPRTAAPRIPPRAGGVPLSGFTPNAALLTAGTLSTLLVGYAATQSDDKPISGQ